MEPAQQTTHEAMVERLVAGLEPVHPLWPVRRRLALWVLVEAAVLVYLAHWGLRGDLAAELHRPQFLLEVGFFFIAGQLIAALALRAAVPGREPARWESLLAAAVVVISIALLLREPVKTDIAMPEFIRAGVRCLRDTFILAVVPWFVLLWAVRRGAVFAAEKAGALVAAAALLFTFAILRTGCPIDNQLHLMVWHLILPAVIGISASALIGFLWLRRWLPL